ncbi:MAG: hypothetical protein AB1568_14470 [Thermodesulfobacteriota bacterium]
MKIQHTAQRQLPPMPRAKRESPAGSSFPDLLKNAAAPPSPPSGLVLLGTISSETPTVSDLLHHSPDYQQQTWQIIHAEINQNQPYRSIRTGTAIYLDPATRQLSWQGVTPSPAKLPPASSSTVAAPPSVASADPPTPVSVRQVPPPASATTGQAHKVSIGAISDTAPTISHLLRAAPRFHDQAWNIIFADCNRAKPFAALRPGTEIFVDPDTRELTWETAAATANARSTGAASRSAEAALHRLNSLPLGLADAVKPYIGRSYREIDCYDLVVRGLARMGINYQGDGGVKDRLVRRAVEEGLPKNAYMNGEGLIEATGRRLYSKALLRVSDPRTEGKQLLAEMEASLSEGCILSFSTHSKGHTGIVSRRGDTWTFINSGEMDNAIDGGSGSQRVGEEILEKEVENWLRRAHDHNQSLLVTLGKPEEIRTAMGPPPPAAARIL